MPFARPSEGILVVLALALVVTVLVLLAIVATLGAPGLEDVGSWRWLPRRPA
jgi:hypothetical protein